MKEITGIYKITSIKLDRVLYVGATLIISNRWGVHINTLKKGYHSNKLMSQHFNKYGLEDLKFDIITECKQSELRELEKHYIKELDPLYDRSKINSRNRKSVAVLPEIL